MHCAVKQHKATIMTEGQSSFEFHNPRHIYSMYIQRFTKKEGVYSILLQQSLNDLSFCLVELNQKDKMQHFLQVGIDAAPAPEPNHCTYVFLSHDDAFSHTLCVCWEWSAVKNMWAELCSENQMQAWNLMLGGLSFGLEAHPCWDELCLMSSTVLSGYTIACMHYILMAF